MYHLTAHQYGILHTSAYNVCVHIKKDMDNALFHLDILMDHATILTGTFPGNQTYIDVKAKATELEASNNDHDANADTLLKIVIGEFDYPPPPSDL